MHNNGYTTNTLVRKKRKQTNKINIGTKNGQFSHMSEKKLELLPNYLEIPTFTSLTKRETL
jgi:hypothetical protein